MAGHLVLLSQKSISLNSLLNLTHHQSHVGRRPQGLEHLLHAPRWWSQDGFGSTALFWLAHCCSWFSKGTKLWQVRGPVVAVADALHRVLGLLRAPRRVGWAFHGLRVHDRAKCFTLRFTSAKAGILVDSLKVRLRAFVSCGFFGPLRLPGFHAVRSSGRASISVRRSTTWCPRYAGRLYCLRPWQSPASPGTFSKFPNWQDQMVRDTGCPSP